MSKKSTTKKSTTKKSGNCPNCDGNFVESVDMKSGKSRTFEKCSKCGYVKSETIKTDGQESEA